MATGRNIILTGFMATGKSTVGCKLAARLGYTFVDTDLVIEQEEGLSIARLFAEKGERYFRERERQVIDQVCAQHHLVIATGGGAIVDATNAARMRASGAVICLTATPEVILSRLQGNAERPLLAGGNPLEKICALLAARAEAYAKADLTIDTSQLSADAVVEAALIALAKGHKQGLYTRLDS